MMETKYITKFEALEAVGAASYDISCYDYEKIEKAIQDIPPADVLPVVRARWEDETGYIFNLFAQRVYCPACKSYAYFCPITLKNFCPNCGADMREAKVDEK